VFTSGDRPAVVIVPLVMLGGGEVPPQPGTKTTPPPDSVKHSLQAPRGTDQLISLCELLKSFKGLCHEIEFKYRGQINSSRYKQEPLLISKCSYLTLAADLFVNSIILEGTGSRDRIQIQGKKLIVLGINKNLY
jgi:hypothetical protein